MSSEAAPQTNRHEREARPDPPRIYAASLSDYNNGRLHGAWIDADQDPEAIGEAIEEMLAGSHYGPAEEFAIHDTDGFGPVRLSEYESLEDIWLIGFQGGELGVTVGSRSQLGRPA
jgi:antirestriction protein